MPVGYQFILKVIIDNTMCSNSPTTKPGRYSHVIRPWNALQYPVPHSYIEQFPRLPRGPEKTNGDLAAVDVSASVSTKIPSTTSAHPKFAFRSKEQEMEEAQAAFSQNLKNILGDRKFSAVPFIMGEYGREENCRDTCPCEIFPTVLWVLNITGENGIKTEMLDELGERKVVAMTLAKEIRTLETALKCPHIHVDMRLCWAEYVRKLEELCDLEEKRSALTEECMQREVVVR